MSENSGERETRSQRRMRERQSLKQTTKKTSRRGLILGGLGLAGLGAAAGLGLTEVLKETDESVVKKEVNRLGIVQSEPEKQLWAEAYKPAVNYPIAENQATLDEAGKRFNAMLDLMRKSTNPIFKQAVDFADSLKISGQLNYELRPDIIARGNVATPLRTAAYFQGGRNHWTIEASAMWVINILNPVSLALFQTHELEHIKNEFKLVEELVRKNPNTTDRQKNDLIQGRHLSQQETVAEEARGYGVSAQSFIYHFGLTGVLPVNSQTSDLDRAVRYIKYGSRVDSPDWLNYIKKYNLG